MSLLSTPNSRPRASQWCQDWRSLLHSPQSQLLLSSELFSFISLKHTPSPPKRLSNHIKPASWDRPSSRTLTRQKNSQTIGALLLLAPSIIINNSTAFSSISAVVPYPHLLIYTDCDPIVNPSKLSHSSSLPSSSLSSAAFSAQKKERTAWGKDSWKHAKEHLECWSQMLPPNEWMNEFFFRQFDANSYYQAAVCDIKTADPNGRLLSFADIVIVIDTGKGVLNPRRDVTSNRSRSSRRLPRDESNSLSFNILKFGSNDYSSRTSCSGDWWRERDTMLGWNRELFWIFTCFFRFCHFWELAKCMFGAAKDGKSGFRTRHSSVIEDSIYPCKRKRNALERKNKKYAQWNQLNGADWSTSHFGYGIGPLKENVSGSGNLPWEFSVISDLYIGKGSDCFYNYFSKSRGLFFDLWKKQHKPEDLSEKKIGNQILPKEFFKVF